MSLIVKERVARFTSSRLCWAKCDAVEGREMNFSSSRLQTIPPAITTMNYNILGGHAHNAMLAIHHGLPGVNISVY